MFPISHQFHTLNQLLDNAALRHEVISHNLANVNTPHYQRLDVEFDTQLKQATSGHREYVSVGAAQVVPEKGLTPRADGNNVDVDREIGEMNRNVLLFQTCSQMLTNHFDMLRRATQGP